jgi:uncharacterized protein
MVGSLNKVQADYLLRAEMVGRLGCSWERFTYVVPIAYVYDGHFIYGHTKNGLKIDVVRKNPTVCFEVDRIDSIANWQSVLAFGAWEELTGREAEDALQLLVNRLSPYTTSETSVPRHGLDRPHAAIDPNIESIVFRIRIMEVTGRYEKQ